MFTMSSADKYLVVFGPETGSQMITLAACAQAMLERDHEVTLLAAEAFEGKIRKAMPEDIPYAMETFPSSANLNTWRDLSTGLTGFALNGSYIQAAMIGGKAVPAIFGAMGEDILKNRDLIKRLDDHRFDLVLAHAMMGYPILLAQHLGVKFVALTPAPPPSMQSRVLGNPVNSATNPEVMTGFTDRMKFLERVKNTLFSFMQWMLGDLTNTGLDALKKKYNIRPELSTLQSLSEAELWFIVSDFTLDFPRPYQPNTVSVGGITATPAKPLPKDLEDFMQSSGDEGVIVFSMGSYINAMESSMADMFAESFAKMPQKILWKSAGDPPSFIPPNVKMAKWLPQNDVLGHPKTRAMIYHCGLNGVFEAIYHAVPVICIPVLGDQWDNAVRLRAKGVGLELTLLAPLKSEELVEAAKTITTDKSFQANMTRLSNIFHDEPLPAPHRLVYHMEKVVRHGGADHLRPAVFELNTIQYNLLDVYAFIAAVVITVLYIVLKVVMILCRFLLRCCRGGNKQKRE